MVTEDTIQTPIPNWLKESDLYDKSLEVGIELHHDSVESRFICETPEIKCMEDFIKVIICVDFWGVYNWPESIFTFMLDHIEDIKSWRDDCGSPIANETEFKNEILN